MLASAASSADGPVFSAAATWRGAPPPAGGAATLVVRVEVEKGWHVNSNAPLEDYLIPTSIALELPSGWSAASPRFPKHRLASFAFSESKVAVLEDTFEVTIEVRRSAGAAAPATLRGVLEAQACDDSSCLAPAEVAFEVDAGGTGEVPAAPAQAPGATAPPSDTAATGLSSAFLGAGLLLQLGLVFLAGLALNLTPCVYPLIPITVGFFAAQREGGRGRTWMLASAYVLGMSITYSALGVTAALTGQLFGAALQSPIVVALIVAVMLALAASMFGLWELRVPAFATRLSGGRSGVGGSLLMGLVVGFVAAPCIGPFVLGLLTYVGQRHDVVLGFLLFFALSLGLGLPYLILGVSTRAVDRLPNSGAWMLGVRQVFGVLLVAMAAYFARPFLPSPAGDWLMAGLLAAGGLYLLIVARPAHDQPVVDRFMRLASLALVIAGLVLAPVAGRHASGELDWQAYEEDAVNAALASGQPVVLDFYADWCAPCKELDEKTFSNADVAERLRSFARFKVDLTRAGGASDALRSRYGVLGVPTIAFFAGGEEITGARLTGYEPPRDFLRRLDAIEAARKVTAAR